VTLGSEEGFTRWHEFFSRPVVKLAIVGAAWLYAHHFFAGIRYLLLDMHIGIEKEPSRTSAVTVLALGVIAALFVAWRIW
jgi:succinate dehydrogenase / fumarate reductase cytochrome b subunit